MNQSSMIVNMKFQADTSQAIAQMKNLQTQLTNIMKITNTSGAHPTTFLVKDLNNASMAAAQLKVQLQNAFNINTGRLDLTKFNAEMKNAGMSLTAYKTALNSIGPMGMQAFNQLAYSIATAEIPMIRLTDGLARFGRTLANTARYQISTSLITGLVRSISTAYSYAQDLNESLNNIRIVTGKNIAEMERFADKANKVAKTLSATTTEYTNASLIYFQQGLSTEEVEKRTAVTVKMAQVTGQAMEQTSDQLTAVWNNFYDGSKSLEYYADVITALGAATASSSDEITQGLEKFAAVAETVGLSYEYATSALATVTAATRQSADVVGTAFKTLFARMQDLELGNTLDDGTTLGKYSQALATVGVSIKDASGAMRDMDDILNDLAERWNLLSSAEQVALAQTVAGTRQYTQLIALMDNWGSMQQNLTTAYSASGALQEQADIYAESWEAARDRVTAALESIYTALLDDDTFIGILNFFADLIENIDHVIDSMGGLKGVLVMISGLLIQTFQGSMANGLSALGNTVQSWTKTGRANLQAKQQEAAILMSQGYGTTGASGLQGMGMENMAKAQMTYVDKTKNLSNVQKSISEELLKQVHYLNEAAQAEAKTTREAEERLAVTKHNIPKPITDSTQLTKDEANALNMMQIKPTYKMGKGGTPEEIQFSSAQLGQLKNVSAQNIQQSAATSTIMSSLTTDMTAVRSGDQKQRIAAIENLQTKLKGLGITADGVDKRIANIVGPKEAKLLQQFATNVDKAEKELKDLGIAVNSADLNKVVDGTVTTEAEILKTADQMDKTGRTGVNIVNRMVDAETNLDVIAQEAGTSQGDLAIKIGETNIQAQGLGPKIEDLRSKTMGWSQSIMGLVGVMSSLSMAITSIVSLFNIWNNQDMSFGEKLLTTITTVGMVLPMVTMAFSEQNAAAIRSFGANIMAAMGFSTEAVAAQTAGTATAGFGTALYTVLWPIGLVMVAIAALVGVIYLIVKAFEKQETATEKATKAYQAQKKALEDLNENLAEVKTNLEEVRSLLEEYYEIQDAFDGLVKGSEQWNENLIKHNEIIRQLIEKYPQLIDMGIIGFDKVSGRYTVTDENVLTQYVEGQAIIQQSEAQLAQTFGQFKVNEAKANLEQTEREELLQQDLNNRIENLVNNIGFQDALKTSIQRDTFSNYSDLAVNASYNNIINWVAQQDSPEDVINLLSSYSQDAAGIAKQVLGNWNELWQEELKTQKSIAEQQEKQQRAIMLSTTSSIIATQQGFSDLNAQQAQAATILFADNLERYYEESVPDYEIRLGQTLSKEAQEYFQKLSGEDSIEVDKNKAPSDRQKLENYDMSAFLEYTNVGQKLVDNYLQKYYNQILADYGDSIEFTATRLKLGEDQFISFASIVGEAIADVAYDAKQLNEIIMQSGEFTAKEAAAITMDFSAVSEEDMQTIGTRVGDRTTGYELTDTYINDALQLKFAGQNLSYNNGLQGTEEGSELEVEANTYINTLKQGALEYNAALAESIKLQSQLAEGEALAAEASEKYNLDPEILKNYAKQLQNTNTKYKENYALAMKAAIANSKFSIGMDELADIVENDIELLKNWNDNNYDTIEAATKASEALGKMFGVDVSLDFVKQLVESGDLETLVSGTEEAAEAFQRLEIEAAKDYIAHLAIDESYKQQFADVLTELSNLENSTEIGVDVDINNTDAINNLNELLAKGIITAEQVENAFGAIGWSPNITTKKIPQTSTSRVSQRFENGLLAGQEITYVMTQTNEVEVPVIGDVDAEGQSLGTNIGSYIGPKSPGNVSLGSSSKSGGGSSSPKEKKEADDEIERHHELKESIDDLSRQYKRMGTERDRAYGQKKLDYFDAEIKQLDKSIAKQKEYVDALKTDVYNDGLALGKYGAEIDSEGRITNYTEMAEAELNKYNEAVEKYNKGLISEETLQQHEEAYNQFKEDVEQYEESLNTLEDESEKLYDDMNERFDKALARADYAVEHSLEKVEDSLSTIDWQLKKIEDDAYAAADAIALLSQKQSTQKQEQDAYFSGIRETLKVSNLTDAEIDKILDPKTSAEEIQSIVQGKNFTPGQIEQLKGYRTGLMDQDAEQKATADDTLDKVLGFFDKFNEDIDREQQKISFGGEVLSNYKNIIDLAGQKTLGLDDIALQRLSQGKVDNSITQLGTSLSVLQANQKELEEVQAKLADKNLSETERKYWEEVEKQLEDTVQQNSQTLLENWQSALDEAKAAYEEMLKQAGDEFEDFFSRDYGNFAGLQNAYDQRKKANERYIADYEKIYELSKLSRDITNSIDETDSIKAKNELKDIQQEIYELQESGAKMSEYEVKELRARYDLKVAEIALEEAQNAKSQVRMQRNSEGGWSYVYTADQDAIDTAQQNYEDALYAYQQMNQEYSQNLQDQLLMLPQQFREAMDKIAQDTTLSAEERKTQMEETKKWYQEQYDFLNEQLGITLQDAQALYEGDWAAYAATSGYKQSADDQWIDSWQETVYAQTTGFKTMEGAYEGFKTTTNTYLGKIEQAYSTWKTNIGTIMSVAGTSVTGFGGVLKKVTNQVAGNAKTSANKIAGSIKTMQDKVGKVFKNAGTAWSNYADYVKKASKENDNMILGLGNLITLLGDLPTNEEDPMSKWTQSFNGLADAINNVTTAINRFNGTTVSSPNITPSTTLPKVKIYADKGTNPNQPTREWEESNLQVIGKSSLDRSILHVKNTSTGDMGWVKYTDLTTGFQKTINLQTIATYDTGGYTGKWDNSGRIAMLHQKELVLNADDTANFLSAVGIVREIAKMIDLNAIIQAHALTPSNTATVDGAGQIIEQSIVIQAEFPNAIYHDEITEAFNTLSTRASQFANRKN